MATAGNSSTVPDSKDSQTGLRDNLRKLLTSYRYPGYPPTDLSIHSSFDQPYLKFDSSRNCFSYPSDDEAPLDSAKPTGGRATPRIIVYMIPGNPGLVEFYEQFLSLLCASFDQVGGCEIVCSGHLGHSLRHNSNLDFRFLENFKLWKLFQSSNQPLPSTPPQLGGSSLDDQIEYHSEIVGKIIHQGIGDPTKTKLVVIGHSVGGHIATKVLERYPDQVMHIIGLFPTISHIARSPNGLRLSPLFSPILLPFINMLQILVSLALPKMIICRLITLYYNPISGTRSESRPAAQGLPGSGKKADDTSEQNLLIMLNFILNINCVSAVLKMARSEMESICALDTKFIHLFHQQLTLFWTSHQADEWVGETEITEIIELLSLHPDTSPDNVNNTINHQHRVVPSHLNQSSILFGDKSIDSQSQVKPSGKIPSWKRMDEGIPHAFCLKDNEVMAKECSALIQQKLSSFNP
ncbi:hypothetical protein PTTG_06319 [Puccinia triticina 1-1 BBBD Race 1]|uniref:AB hydrolase-1 domain-containing protein n=2 Tax=Puccinia triticina TaxID=208348 RepID=A0A0C4EZQ9_PUCT1|nr:uncharacterized protein PtA15_3A149 [Puccinia triticina]OAV96322.1 hypothetical protein PTTG_06319 [Puccinia triticina 1-1 BBBD Race 1]WAQ82785.1 hypothetical protein PtA15_3A149 [Puccinia triticina]WAR53626.1 hypothetical protein PtB15_3B134 [Puccinia triticina]